jgi:UDP-N-acetylglucosamine:LPS N-acetylglucosamine transferase
VKKILLLPFLSMSSGHHQVADAIAEYFRAIDPRIECRKVDIFRYSYGIVESAVSRAYVKWIRRWPGVYDWAYRKAVCRTEQQADYPAYAMLFEAFFRKLLKEERPDLVVCTHALPSRLLGRLKLRGQLSVPAVNVYTDFFINSLWALEGIDYHFVPHASLLPVLLERGVERERIFVTGIPVHPIIAGTATVPSPLPPPLPLRKPLAGQDSGQTSMQAKVLIAGGSLGLGVTADLLGQLGSTGRIRYIVLCGKNSRLRAYIDKLGHPLIRALPYIASRKEMNALYDGIDGILAKPGGVTISECLHKRLPIFVYHALPGQEQMNLEFLKREGLVWHLDDMGIAGEIAVENAEDYRGTNKPDIERQIWRVLSSEETVEAYRRRVEQFISRLSDRDIGAVIARIVGSAEPVVQQSSGRSVIRSD